MAGLTDRVTFTLFLRLKLRLIRGGLRGELVKQLGFAFSLIGALLAAFSGFVFFALIRFAPADVALNLGVIAFTLLTLSWIVVPLLAFGVDETLDPSRLALFPLTTRQLAIGLFAASAAGPWPIASLIVLAGGIAGLATSPGGVLIGLVAVPLAFALCLMASRAVTTALSGALRSRRGRDVLMVAAVAVILLLQLPNVLLNGGFSADPRVMLEATGGVLRWTPPGLAAHAITDGGLIGLAELIVVAMVVVALAWAWIAALRRALVTPDAPGQSGGTVRRSWIGRFLPQGMLGAVVAKELKYARREPRGRVAWLTAIVVSAILTFSLRTRDGVDAGLWSVLGPAALAGLMVGLQSANSFGIDGRALWMNAVAFSREEDVRTDLAGRHLAVALMGMPVLAVVSVASAWLAGEPAWALAAFPVAACVLALTLGFGAVTSVLVPYTLPERLNAFSSAAPGQGGQAFLASFGVMTGAGLLALPLIVPLLLGDHWLFVLALPYGWLVAAAGRRIAGRIGFRRYPALLAAVSRPT